jgi:methionyl-tRNA formyltransferase
VTRARWVVFADIEPDDTAFTVYERMTKLGVELLLESYPAVLADQAPRIPQDPRLATTMPRRPRTAGSNGPGRPPGSST